MRGDISDDTDDEWAPEDHPSDEEETSVENSEGEDDEESHEESEEDEKQELESDLKALSISTQKGPEFVKRHVVAKRTLPPRENRGIPSQPFTQESVSPKKKKDPNIPKKPLSAFILFSQEQRPILAAEMPTATFIELATQLGHRWKEMGELAKEKYHLRALEERARYEREMNEYFAAHGEEHHCC
eukprot:TRINITY_DN22177_c0_g1_i1.p1 TRINITY_DN22177_c0_g1~~TRINITY_DN22177_c0_g1_i1.p1  ORF type:complete len:199 (+),score=47.83 TRINITY_DN22177_c0_g1_i1:41-598(+)